MLLAEEGVSHQSREPPCQVSRRNTEGSVSVYHRLSIAAVVVLLLVAGCGEVEPTATPVPATATQFAQRAAGTPLLSTATPTPPTPTETTGGERGLGQGLCRGRGQRVLGHVVAETDVRQRRGCEATGRDAAVNLTQMPAPYPKSSDKEEST